MAVDNDLVMYETQLVLLQRNSAFASFFIQTNAKLHQRVEALANRLLEEKYPFYHAKGDVSMADFVFSDFPQVGDALGTFKAAHEAWNKLADLYFRIIGRLASMGGKMELEMALRPTRNHRHSMSWTPRRRKRKNRSNRYHRR